MDSQSFIVYADKVRRGTRDPALIEFLDYAVRLAQKVPAKTGKFDRNAYQRAYMRKWRARRKK